MPIWSPFYKFNLRPASIHPKTLTMKSNPLDKWAPGSLSDDPRWQPSKFVHANFTIHPRRLRRYCQELKVDRQLTGPRSSLYYVPDLISLVLAGHISRRISTAHDNAIIDSIVETTPGLGMVPATAAPVSSTSSTSGLLMLIISIVVLVISFLQPLTSLPKVNFILWCFRVQAVLFFLVSLFLFMKRRKPGVEEEITIGVPAARPVVKKKKARWIFVLAGIIVVVILFFSVTKFTILTIIFVISIAQICYTWGTVKRLPVNLFSKIILWTLLIVFPLGGYGAARLVSNIKVKQVEQPQNDPEKNNNEQRSDAKSTDK